MFNQYVYELTIFTERIFKQTLQLILIQNELIDDIELPGCFNEVFCKHYKNYVLFTNEPYLLEKTYEGIGAVITKNKYLHVNNTLPVFYFRDYDMLTPIIDKEFSVSIQRHIIPAENLGTLFMIMICGLFLLFILQSTIINVYKCFYEYIKHKIKFYQHFRQIKFNDSMLHESCSICLEEYIENEVLLKVNKCNHVYHKNCIMKWMDESEICPLCRETI